MGTLCSKRKESKAVIKRKQSTGIKPFQVEKLTIPSNQNKAEEDSNNTPKEIKYSQTSI